MAYIHDDWHLELYYSNWLAVETLLNNAISPSIDKLNTSELKLGNHGYWLQNGEATMEKKHATLILYLIVDRNMPNPSFKRD